MSEIKGQILGIILVLMVFGVVAGAMTAVFSSLSKTVTDKVSQLDDDIETMSFYNASDLFKVKP